MTEPVIFPRFIPDKPDGKDLYEGQSQKTLGDNICQFITENDTNNKKVIGIEGEWGSGKSNVIEILKEKLKDTYYFFVFDAWGHQEDLTRRSLLEGLLIKLIDDDVLKGKKSDWQKELKTLLAKTVEKEQKNIPQFSWAVILSVIGILFMPITKFITDSYLKARVTETSHPDFWNYLVATLLLITSFVPLLYFVGRSIYKAPPGERKNIIRELFYIYKGKEIKNTSHETISEDEPTVRQFSDFLENLEQNSKKKLVIVFDNMDRLPSAKVKEIWSSIHTFFASEGNQIKSWAIVPFDNDHISNIFNDEDKKKDSIKKYADSYIHKTFSIVFHVSPPVLTDWKHFFSTKFTEAFGTPPPITETLETIFDYHHLVDPKIKPRDIICFINDLVALKKLWKEQIPFRYLALFALKRMEIMQNPFEAITTKKYLGTLGSLFESDPKLDTIISALSFNVPVEKADEVLLKRPIEQALFGEGDLIKISSHKHFFTIFDSVFYNSKPNVLTAISCLDALPLETREKPEMNNYWEKISQSILSVSPFALSHVEAVKVLARRIKNQEIIENLLKFLFIKSLTTNDQGIKLFTGSRYYALISDIDSLLQEVWPAKNIEDLLTKNSVEAPEYFDFIQACPKSFEKYKVECEIQKINSSLIEKFDANEISQFTIQLDLLKEKDLAEFKNHISAIVSGLTASTAKYQEIVTNLFDVGKSLSLDGKTLFVVPEVPATAILTADPAHNRAIDLLLSIIVANMANPQPAHSTDATCKKMLADISLQNSFIESYTYYFNYTDLIKYYFQFPSPLIKSAICEITKSPNEVTGSDVEFAVSKYNDIKASIFDNDTNLCTAFVSKLNNFYNTSEYNFVSDTSLAYIIPLLKDCHSLDCDLIKDLVSQANNFINGLSEEVWVVAFKEWQTSKHIELFRALEELNKYNNDKLPIPAYNAYGKVIDSISKKELPLPADIEFWNKTLGFLNGNFINIYKNVRDQLLNYNHPEVTIEELLFFEKGLFQFGKLDEDRKVADDVLRRIFMPLASPEANYTNVLKRNVQGIKKIIEQGHDLIIDFKNTLDSRCPEIYNDTEIKDFSNFLVSKTQILIEEQNRGKDDNSEEQK